MNFVSWKGGPPLWYLDKRQRCRGTDGSGKAWGEDVKNLPARTSWGVILLLCLTLGLTPYRPPHVVEKLALLFQGRLSSPVDWFDLVLHGFPWVLLCVKAAGALRNR